MRGGLEGRPQEIYEILALQFTIWIDGKIETASVMRHYDKA